MYRRLISAVTLCVMATSTMPALAADHGVPSSFAITINGSLPGLTAPLQDSAQAETIDEAPSQTAKVHRSLNGWSLPITGPLTLVKRTITSVKPKQTEVKAGDELVGSVDYSDPYESVTYHIDELLEEALVRDPRSEALEKAVDHYRKPIQRVIAEGKDATNYVIPYRGFGPSKEAGNLILDEDVKIKSKAAAEYARQKQVDEMHLKVVSSMMQIAMGLGMDDQIRGEEITESGVSSLGDLVGRESAERTKLKLTALVASMNIPDEVYDQQMWDVHQKQDKQREILELSLEDDPVLHQIKKHLHKYNKRSKAMMVTSSVVQTLLGAASLTPTFIGPAAKTALVTFIMATGGPEQAKLMKELYLDKRLESRWKVLNEETHLALDNYQLAILTRNPVLLGCSESVVGQMIGGHNIEKVFGRTLITPDGYQAPEVQ